MIRRVSLICLVLLYVGLGLIACQTSVRQCPPPVDTSIEAARVRDVIDQFFIAAKRRDWDAAGDLMSADFEFYTDEALSFNKEAYVRVLKEDDLQLEYMELKDLDIRVSNDCQMAWSKYRGLFKSTIQGKQNNVETAETMIFKNENGAWKITRAHASAKPLAASAETRTETGVHHDKN